MNTHLIELARTRRLAALKVLEEKKSELPLWATRRTFTPLDDLTIDSLFDRDFYESTVDLRRKTSAANLQDVLKSKTQKRVHKKLEGTLLVS